MPPTQTVQSFNNSYHQWASWLHTRFHERPVLTHSTRLLEGSLPQILELAAQLDTDLPLLLQDRDAKSHLFEKVYNVLHRKLDILSIKGSMDDPICVDVLVLINAIWAQLEPHYPIGAYEFYGLRARILQVELDRRDDSGFVQTWYTQSISTACECLVDAALFLQDYVATRMEAGMKQLVLEEMVEAMERANKDLVRVCGEEGAGVRDIVALGNEIFVQVSFIMTEEQLSASVM